MQQNVPKTELKNFGFLVPHLHEFEGELRDLLIEIDKLIERKKTEWEAELHDLERKLQLKVQENENLQSLISLKELELKETSGKLNFIESTFAETNPEQELNAIKRKVDQMQRAYENLQKKYQRQLEAEKERSSVALHKMEQTNSFLQKELAEIKEAHQGQMNYLSKQLKEERSKTDRLEKRCQKLQKESEDLTKRMERELSESHSLEGVYQSRCLVLERELEMTKQLSETQMTEYEEVQRTASERVEQLHRLRTELTCTRKELAASNDAMYRVEHIVLRHLTALSKASGQGVMSLASTTSTTTTTTPRSTPLSRAELDCMVKELQKRLGDADRGILNRFTELRRLESACQTASTTIHRLVEARTQSMQQVASLSAALNKAIHGMLSVTERVDNLEKIFSEKLLHTKNGLTKISQDLAKLRSARLVSSAKNAGMNSEMSTQTLGAIGIETATQTVLHPDSAVESLLQQKLEYTVNKWHSQTEHLQAMISQLTEERRDLQLRLNQQQESAERLQKENLALSDLLTGAEQFNRTRISCPSVHSRKLSPTLVTPERGSLIDAEVQVDRLPMDPPKSTRHVLFLPRKSKSTTAPPPSAVPLLESDLCSDSQLSSVRFRPLSPLSVNANNSTMTVMATPQQSRTHGASPTIMEGNETVNASINASGCPSPEFHTRFQMAVKKSPSLDLVQPKASGDSFDSLSPTISPSEYENFALPRSRLHPILKSSPQHHPHGTGTAASLTPTDPKRTEIHRSRSVHIRSPPTGDVMPAHGSFEAEQLDHVADERRTLRFQPKHMMDQYVPEHQSSLMASGEPSLPQASSTACRAFQTNTAYRDHDLREVNHEHDVEGDDDDDDASVCHLASKFLADEKKHSIRLEQQIDAHLQMLKSQLGMHT